MLSTVSNFKRHVKKDGTNFLGMNITEGMEGNIKIQVYDKRKDFPFKVVRYPHLDSEIPTNLPYGVFTGLTYRNDRICTEKEDFIKESLDLAKCLWSQGSTLPRLISAFNSYIGKKKKKNIRDLRKRFKDGLQKVLFFDEKKKSCDFFSDKTRMRSNRGKKNQPIEKKNNDDELDFLEFDFQEEEKKEMSESRKQALDFLNNRIVRNYQISESKNMALEFLDSLDLGE